ncbi:putative isomerase YddE [Clostridium ljungdahlii DSM 13528]|uniref:Isomerase YddE n=1 Tax=Clostridium ljungdahlii (strain ATCC 55383 / DSM 13528 / PETC) TaxID=748727 RepID=D8GQ44_CLOLD|nr:PhzF family phenazine biosynthesis protein [Clostridium ljungdahlii]ADK16135.1 predicted phenazine biosynthesis PhzC/PhzF protein [Clostridium ljungdahlii DSM 13528]OAA84220.1 putative isomerase YddE [Clostridium ljungdahlii DSM 13528]
MNVKAYTLNSFAKCIEGGNPAGVVINADDLSEYDMKKVAGIIGFSETAFVMKSDLADFKVRFFTPNEEVDICGHATIATFSTLLSQGRIEPGKYSQETKAGVLNVELKEDLSIMMSQNTPSYYETICKQEIAESLNITTAEISDELPIQIVSTGLRDILIPIKNIDMVNAIKPNFEMVSKISSKYNTIGYHIFTLESLNGSNAYCRNLAPLYGIPEESATGTSNGALACYLFKYGKIKSDHTNRIVIEQGYSMGKPSEIIVSLVTKGKEIIEVKVGGKALNLSEIEVEI